MSNGTIDLSLSTGVRHLIRRFAQMRLNAKQRRRQRVLLVLFPGVIGVGIISLDPDRISDLFRWPLELVFGAAIVSCGLSLMALAGWYLQTGFSFKEEKEQEDERAVTEQDDRTAKELAALRYQLGEVQRFASQQVERVARLEAMVERQAAAGPNAAGAAIQELAAEVRDAVVIEAASSVIAEITRKIEQSYRMRTSKIESENSFSASRERLVREVGALMRRGNLNLLMGGMTTIAGIGLLTYFVINLPVPSSDPMQFFITFVPKVALVIFIEAFAYFFLKLYKTSLEEIKFYQNEITTIEQRYLALISAAGSAMEDTYSKVISALGSTDRNPVIGGTIKEDLERERTLLQSGVEALKALAPAAKA